MEHAEPNEEQPELAAADAVRDAADVAAADDEKGAPALPCGLVKAPQAQHAPKANDGANERNKKPTYIT